MAPTEVGTAKSPTGGRPVSANRACTALADGPDFLFARQGLERLGDKIRQYIIELADKSLIRAEDNGAYRLRIRVWPSGLLRAASVLRFLKHTARPSSTVRS